MPTKSHQFLDTPKCQREASEFFTLFVVLFR
jgi:hypothetical protein